jgi:hypothetical protein
MGNITAWAGKKWRFLGGGGGRNLKFRTELGKEEREEESLRRVLENITVGKGERDW